MTKECLAAVADTSISGRRVARELDALAARRGKPGFVVSGRHRRATGPSDDGDAPSSHLERHARMDPEDRRGLALHRPGQADARHGICEAFDGRMREEFLNETLFFSRDQAREAVARLVADYNRHRPRSALGYATPAAYAAQLNAMGDPHRAPEPLRGSPIVPSARERHADRRTLASEG